MFHQYAAHCQPPNSGCPRHGPCNARLNDKRGPPTHSRSEPDTVLDSLDRIHGLQFGEVGSSNSSGADNREGRRCRGRKRPAINQKSIYFSTQRGEVSFRRYAGACVISQPTGSYKWLDRFAREGEAGLCEQSRAPVHPARGTPRFMQDRIGELRQTHPSSGAKKLLAWLHPEGAARGLHHSDCGRRTAEAGRFGAVRGRRGHASPPGWNRWHTHRTRMTSGVRTSKAGSCCLGGQTLRSAHHHRCLQPVSVRLLLGTENRRTERAARDGMSISHLWTAAGHSHRPMVRRSPAKAWPA